MLAIRSVVFVFDGKKFMSMGMGCANAGHDLSYSDLMTGFI